MLRQYPERQFEVIIVSSYEDYTLKAFHYGVAGYLLKPVGKDEFCKAVNRVTKLLNATPPVPFNRKSMKKSQTRPDNTDNYLVRKQFTENSITAKYDIKPRDVIRIEAERNYSRIYVAKGNDITIPVCLKQVFEELPQNMFIRPHKSHVVNIDFVEKYKQHNNNVIVMTDGVCIPVARRKQKAITTDLRKM